MKLSWMMGVYLPVNNTLYHLELIKGKTEIGIQTSD
jgi:hypothetical protein